MRHAFRSIPAIAMILCFVLPGSAQSKDHLQAVKDIAAAPGCVSYSWKERGRAPTSYIQGVALVFARSVCHPDRDDVQIASSPPDVRNKTKDALAFYADTFKANGMSNDISGVETLRHAYTLLIGLGMRESSGKYCEGRDVSQCFAEADSAEAGLFQTSYGVRTRSPVLTSMFERYKADRSGCMLPEFQGNVACKIRKSHNSKCPDATSDIAGSGPGADWQRLTKQCPAFATEYAAVVMRTWGGGGNKKIGEFGPIRRNEAEVVPACDAMLQEVQNYVKQNPEICSVLK